MAKRKGQKRPEQKSDYDGAWKESARRHFREIMEKYFASIATLIDWSYPPEWFDLDEAWRPDEYAFRIGDFETRLRFPVSKLIEKLDGDWREDQSLPVQIARAQIEALPTASDPAGRYRAKWRLVRNLYDLGHNAEELREIFRLIDWMMSLREDLNQKFEQELIALEESLNMPYVTSVERIAEARGEAKGVASLLVEQLAGRCGPLPDGIEQRIRGLPMRRLRELGKAVFDFNSIDDVQSWLDEFDAAAD